MVGTLTDGDHVGMETLTCHTSDLMRLIEEGLTPA